MKLRRDADGEHEERDRNHDQFFAREKIGKCGAISGRRATEEQLHRSQKSDGGEEQAQNGNRGEGRQQAQRIL